MVCLRTAPSLMIYKICFKDAGTHLAKKGTTRYYYYIIDLQFNNNNILNNNKNREKSKK